MDKLSRDEQKKIKKSMRTQYKELEVLVNNWDPIGLISGGAPNDEYDCLTTQLLSLLYKGKQLNEIKEFIYIELDEHFGYGLNEIRKEYQDAFKNQLDDFCRKMYYWFNNQKYIKRKE